METTKMCTKCKIAQPLSNYNKSSIHKDGLRPSCKACKKADRIKYHSTTESREKKSRAQKKYRENKREKYLATRKAWNQKKRQEAQMQMLCTPNKSCVFFLICEITGVLFTSRRPYARFSPQGKKAHIRNIQKSEEYKAQRKKRRPTQEAKLKAANPKYRIRLNISRAINQSLKIGKGTAWQDAVGYTREELMSHLERQFTQGMTWDNYGKKGWHIDHIRPVASFSFQSIEEQAFKECWSLSNLQPLWWFDNLKKGDKYVSDIAA